MADNNVMHGAIAIIKVDGKVIGKMKNIRVNENVRRQEVIGLGKVFAQEAPVVGWAGTLSCSSFLIDLKADGVPNAFRRKFVKVVSTGITGESSLQDQLVLDDVGVRVEIYKSIKGVVGADGVIAPDVVPFCVVENCLIESESFDVSEGQLSGKDQSFKYLTPYTLT